MSPESRIQFMTDAYAPLEIAHRIREAGVTKARADALTVLVLGVLAGAFISFGALLFIFVMTGASSGFGVSRLFGGLAFSLGLVMVVVAGAELFTGNNLVAMAWASRRITTLQLVRNWVLAYVGNVAGSLGIVALVLLAGVDDFASGGVGETAESIGAHKSSLGILQTFALAILCNVLVCLAIWLAMGGRSVTDKVLAVVFPITAFVAMGFEHSIANWFFLPYAIALDGFDDGGLIGGAAVNLVIVTIGNIIGGSVLVAGVYWLAYLRHDRRTFTNDASRTDN
jgi:formate/nitrite transporter